MTAEEKSKVLELFLDNFNAVSVSGSDFGRTDLVKFEIKLKPGSQPVHPVAALAGGDVGLAAPTRLGTLS